MHFDVVVSPLMLTCGKIGIEILKKFLLNESIFLEFQKGFEVPRHVFQCGDVSASDYCVSGGFVCDGHVNCMLPGRYMDIINKI